MKRKTWVFSFLALLGFLALTNFVFETKVKYHFKRGESESFRLFAKPGFEKWSAFEFSFLKAFYYTLSLRVYLGKLSEKYLTPPPFAKEPIVRTAEVVTRLCPYYYDIYYIANGYLSWDFGDVETANRFLKKGISYYPKRWIFHLYLGFNYFYFLKDYEKGAHYLLKASELSGRPFYAHLAAKLLYASGRTEIAIRIVKNMLENTKDEGWRKSLEIRLKALEGIYTIEKAVEAFREKIGRNPENIQELVKTGFLKSIPEDPYGGEFYLDEAGNVKTTSNLAFTKQNRESKTN
ncbi:MAG: hypothetical protein QMD82_04200 [bacterium]|nr:hypothetical protein [bacterium]